MDEIEALKASRTMDNNEASMDTNHTKNVESVDEYFEQVKPSEENGPYQMMNGTMQSIKLLWMVARMI